MRGEHLIEIGGMLWLAAFIIYLFNAFTAGALEPTLLTSYCFGITLVSLGFILVVTGQYMRRKERHGGVE
jgi:hypothetical protein